MAILIAFAAAIGLAACYSPSLRDCTVSCTAASDCAQGQVCGRAGLCAAPDVADRCADVIADAGSVDTQPSTDATPHVNLHIHIDGPGEVDFTGNSCRSGAPQNGNCDFSVVSGASISLDAVDINDHTFEKWTAGPCVNLVTRSCTFAPSTATSVSAKWH